MGRQNVTNDIKCFAFVESIVTKAYLKTMTQLLNKLKCLLNDNRSLKGSFRRRKHAMGIYYFTLFLIFVKNFNNYASFPGETLFISIIQIYISFITQTFM